MTELLQALRSVKPTLSNVVRVVAPEIAVDGANVMLEVYGMVPGVDGFVVFVENNPVPLVAAYRLAPEVLPYLQMRVKVAETSNVWVVARIGGQFYQAYKTVKVTVGGCGAGWN